MGVTKLELVGKLRQQIMSKDSTAIKAFERVYNLGGFRKKEMPFWDKIYANHGKYTANDIYVFKSIMPNYATFLINNSIKEGQIKLDKNGYKW